MTQTLTRKGAQLPIAANYHVPLFHTSIGDEAVALAMVAGLVLDEWQQNVLRASLGYKQSGKWACGDMTLIVPRQNGKGSILEARELAGLFLLPEKLILHSAHEHKTAKEGFRRLSKLIEQTPKLALGTKFRNSGADTSIETADGSRCMFVARSGGSGRGFTTDCVILDEAYNLTDDTLAAMLPTLAAVPNAQIWYVSSTGMDDSEVLKRMSAAGQRKEDGMGYFEWKADDDAKPNDVEQWYQANPSMGIRGLDEDTVRKELRAMGDTEFKRERLGLWESNDITSVISKELWDSLLYKPDELESKTPGVSSPAGKISFAVDVDPDSTRASIYACGEDRNGMLSIVRVAEDEGTEWVPEYLKTRVEKWKPKSVALDGSSPAGALIPALTKLDVPFTVMSSADCYQAVAGFLTDVCANKIRHRDDIMLEDAVAAGIKREVGNKGAWLWARKNYEDDLTPLVAATYARHAWLAFEDDTRTGVVW